MEQHQQVDLPPKPDGPSLLPNMADSRLEPHLPFAPACGHEGNLQQRQQLYDHPQSSCSVCIALDDCWKFTGTVLIADKTWRHLPDDPHL